MMIDEQLYENFKLYFPVIAERAINITQDGPFDIVVRMDDGTAMLYSDLNNTIRRLPNDSNNITEKEFRREFRFRVYKILNMRGMTQKDLARMTGITEANLSGYMTGKRTPTFYTASKIAKALDCSVEDFVYD